jgi:hypothetical protein
MLRAMVAGEYVWGPISLDKAIEKVRDYKVTESTIKKALELV